MRKPISIVLIISLIFTFFVLVSKDQSDKVSSKKVEVTLGTQKKVPAKVKPVKKEPVIVKPKPKPVVKEPIAVKEKTKEVDILVTYYSNSYEDCGKTDAISASGKNLNRSGNMTYVAAPKDISFGTKIDVDKIGSCLVEDRGGKIKHVTLDGVNYLKLDVYVKCATKQELIDKGILKTKGRIYEN